MSWEALKMCSELSCLSSHPQHTHIHTRDTPWAQIRCFSHHSIMVGAEALLSNYGAAIALQLSTSGENELNWAISLTSRLWLVYLADTCQLQSRQGQQAAFQVWQLQGLATLGWPQGWARCFHSDGEEMGQGGSSQKIPPRTAFSFTTWIPWKKEPTLLCKPGT